MVSSVVRLMVVVAVVVMEIHLPAFRDRAQSQSVAAATRAKLNLGLFSNQSLNNEKKTNLTECTQTRLEIAQQYRNTEKKNTHTKLCCASVSNCNKEGKRGKWEGGGGKNWRKNCCATPEAF